MEHAHKDRDTRCESLEELRETGEQKGGLSERDNSYKIRHLRFEEAFELNNLDYFL